MYGESNGNVANPQIRRKDQLYPEIEGKVVPDPESGFHSAREKGLKHSHSVKKRQSEGDGVGVKSGKTYGHAQN